MAKERAGGGEELLTLTEVSKRTGVSMPTLQRYKKTYSDRIPSVGEGRKQRYPESALAVFLQLKDENMARVGRPKKGEATERKAGAGRRGRRSAAEGKKGRSAGSRRPRGRKQKSGDGSVVSEVVTAVRDKASAGLLTLTEIGQRTGISYPTLMRYVKTHLDKLPHEGSGRKRRFLPSAVEVFAQLRGESRGGRPTRGKVKSPREASGQSMAPALAELSRVVQRLEGRLAAVEKQLKKPLKITIGR